METRNKTLLIKDLAPTITLRNLLNTFEKFGVLASVRIRQSGAEDDVNYRGFVEYQNFEDSEKVSKTENVIICGNKYEVEFNPIKKVNFPQRKMLVSKNKAIVRNYNEKASDEEIMREFECLSVERPKNDEKNFFFVKFETKDELEKVISKFDGKNVDGSEIYMKKALYKPIRKINKPLIKDQ